MTDIMQFHTIYPISVLRGTLRTGEKVLLKCCV